MKDVQNEKTKHPIEINRVGIKDVTYPIRILTKSNSYQHSIANIKFSIQLPASERGTHMSRFIEIIEKHKADINGKTVKEIIKDITKILNCEQAEIELTFPYFIEKRSPVSRKSSIMATTCGYKNIIKDNNIESRLIVEVIVTTLCPCSKEISEYGAHNQRATVRLEVTEKDFVWFEDLIDLIEQCASAPIYPLLKRVDEKFVTEQAYDNPRFVEDLVREIYFKLIEKYNDKISKVRIAVQSDESIHLHEAFAVIEKEVKG